MLGGIFIFGVSMFLCFEGNTRNPNGIQKMGKIYTKGVVFKEDDGYISNHLLKIDGFKIHESFVERTLKKKKKVDNGLNGSAEDGNSLPSEP